MYKICQHLRTTKKNLQGTSILAPQISESSESVGWIRSSLGCLIFEPILIIIFNTLLLSLIFLFCLCCFLKSLCCSALLTNLASAPAVAAGEYTHLCYCSKSCMSPAVNSGWWNELLQWHIGRLVAQRANSLLRLACLKVLPYPMWYSGFSLWMAPLTKAESVTLMFLFNDTVCGDGKRGTGYNEKNDFMMGTGVCFKIEKLRKIK